MFSTSSLGVFVENSRSIQLFLLELQSFEIYMATDVSMDIKRHEELGGLFTQYDALGLVKC